LLVLVRVLPRLLEIKRKKMDHFMRYSFHGPASLHDCHGSMLPRLSVLCTVLNLVSLDSLIYLAAVISLSYWCVFVGLFVGLSVSSVSKITG